MLTYQNLKKKINKKNKNENQVFVILKIVRP